MSNCYPCSLMRVVQVGLQVLAFPEMDLAALGLSAWVVPRYPSASLGRYDRLVARRFALCVPACLSVFMSTCVPVVPVLLGYLFHLSLLFHPLYLSVLHHPSSLSLLVHQDCQHHLVHLQDPNRYNQFSLLVQ